MPLEFTACNKPTKNEYISLLAEKVVYYDNIEFLPPNTLLINLSKQIKHNPRFAI